MTTQKDIFNREIKATHTVELLVDPFGRYEVEAVSESTVYLNDNLGITLCDGNQVMIIS